MNLFKQQKIATVEEIHHEFDTAEERIIQQCNEFLAELQIPTETQVERKAKLLKELGFTNSGLIKEAEVIEKRNTEIILKSSATKAQLEDILRLKRFYPLDKFITVQELDRICNTYNLIHGPVAHYVNDVPEKNLLEMKNSKPLHYDHVKPSYSIITVLSFEDRASKEIKAFCKDPIEMPHRYREHNISLHDFRDFLKSKGIGNGWISNDISKINVEQIATEGFFIAAPKSHFNLKDLSKKSKFGFFKTKSITLEAQEDPVVFQYCKNDICRIITKWGTADDQSYLDPLLVNEIQN